MTAKDKVTVILGMAGPKVHSVVYKGQVHVLNMATPVEVAIYVPRAILKALSPVEDEPAALKVTFELES